MDLLAFTSGGDVGTRSHRASYGSEHFNDLPGWQKRGSLVVWGVVGKVGFNPVTSEEVVVERRALKRLEELPYGDEYREFLRGSF